MSNYDRPKIHMPEKRAFGKRLKELLDDNKMTQAQLSEILGVGVQTISNWVNGYYFPDTDTMIRIADHFGCDVDNLIGRLPESTHDIHFVREFTGLSEAAIKKISNPNLGHTWAETLSHLIMSEGFYNLMTAYKIFLVAAENLKDSDLDEPAFKMEGTDKVILNCNEATHHFMRKASLAMTHICEEDYFEKMDIATKKAQYKWLDSKEQLVKEYRKNLKEYHENKEKE